eukprot:scaffold25924_cov66-Phaeocystis_antarctica.AAC.4
MGVVEDELLELRQHTSRRQQRTWRRRRRHKSGEALRGQPPQGRREGHQPRVADGGVSQREDLEPRQGASAQGGGERQRACVIYLYTDELEKGHRRQRARAQPLCQQLHAVPDRRRHGRIAHADA